MKQPRPEMKGKRDAFRITEGVLWALMTLLTAMLCISVGSVSIPLEEVWHAVFGMPVSRASWESIIHWTRLPRVLCAGVMGAALSLSGAAMQGLLRNPLADGSTLGISSGAALGAALSIVLGISIPGMVSAGPAAMAMAFAFGSLMLILALAYSMDRSLATHSIIMIGVIFTMMASGILSLLITFSGEKLKTITYWTMGSLNGKTYEQLNMMTAALAVCGLLLLTRGRELNAFAVGEENAKHIGVPVRRVKLQIMIASSVLIGVCVSVGGSIAFVGLIVPHMIRLWSGPNHRRLLPRSMFAGAIFLMLADLGARTVLRPTELPVGVVTSMVGAIVFIGIFVRSRKGGKSLW